ncbi:amidase family protein [Jeotgalibacillus soli]|nr:amidase family protein [Jeotgalibacillus soli]
MKGQRLEDRLNWLADVTTEELGQSMTNGDLTSEELVRLYMTRIMEDNQKGRSIRAIATLNPEAISIARMLDAERKNGIIRSPLHGVPILLKDNISTADHMPTSAGSLALAENRAKQDAHLVQLVRIAGMVILGKTNMTEWANFMSERMPNGYSSRGGQVLNPYNPGVFDVGGSSSGSAAAVACGFAPLAVGTETTGSILNPACQNGVVGIKPTVGTVSRAGIIPISYTQDTAGVFGITVKDAALAFASITGHDPGDPATGSSPWPEPTAFIWKDQKTNAIKGKRIGLLHNEYYPEATKDQMKIFKLAVEKLKSLGAIIVEDIILASHGEQLNNQVLIHEFKVGIEAYLQDYGSRSNIQSLQDIINFNLNHKELALVYGQSVLEESNKTSGTLTEEAYLAALQKDHLASKENGLDEAMKLNQVDILLSPHDHGEELPAKAGYPSIAVPAGFSERNEPIGITFTGGAFSEPMLIPIAHAFELATKHRKMPSSHV